jgi:hypothetical protein
MSQRRIDTYFLRSSSSTSTTSTVIEIDSDAPTDDEQPSPPTSSQQSIESYLVSPATRSSSALTAAGDDGWTSEDDHLPLSVLLARWTRPSAVARRADIRRAVVHRAVARRPVLRRTVVRRALSDISNVCPSRDQWQQQYYAAQKRFYYQVRQRFAHPADNTMCAYCGVREHTALHHEEGFERAGTGVSTQSRTAEASRFSPSLRLSRLSLVLHHH